MSKIKKIIFWAIGIILALLIICLIVNALIICSSAKDRFEDFDFTKEPEYISCSLDSDCIIQGCNCLNEKGIDRFNFWAKFCGVFPKCKPPTSCTCENNQCQSHYNLNIWKDIYTNSIFCTSNQQCPEGSICYRRIEENTKNYECGTKLNDCMCYKVCESDNECPQQAPYCNTMQIGDIYGLCIPGPVPDNRKCFEDSNCEAKFSTCSCRYECINKADNIEVCSKMCPESGEILIPDCNCINNECVKKEKRVSLTTDKTEYEKGEEVKVTVKTNLDNKIEFYTIGNEFFNGTMWELIDWDIDCPCMAKCEKAPKIINPNEEIEFIWDQTGDDCQQVSEGKYRFRTDWRDLTKEDYEIPAAVSNEFIIR